MQITYTLKHTKQPEQGEYDPETKTLSLASGRELNLALESDIKLAKKLIYAKIVTSPQLELTTLQALTKM